MHVLERHREEAYEHSMMVERLLNYDEIFAQDPDAAAAYLRFIIRVDTQECGYTRQEFNTLSRRARRILTKMYTDLETV